MILEQLFHYLCMEMKRENARNKLNIITFIILTNFSLPVYACKSLKIFTRDFIQKSKWDAMRKPHISTFNWLPQPVSAGHTNKATATVNKTCSAHSHINRWTPESLTNTHTHRNLSSHYAACSCSLCAQIVSKMSFDLLINSHSFDLKLNYITFS